MLLRLTASQLDACPVSSAFSSTVREPVLAENYYMQVASDDPQPP